MLYIIQHEKTNTSFKANSLSCTDPVPILNSDLVVWLVLYLSEYLVMSEKNNPSFLKDGKRHKKIVNNSI